MKRSPLSRGSKQLKRSGFKTKSTPTAKKRVAGQISGKKRHTKTPLKKLKDQLWQLCRKVVKKQFLHVCYTCGKTLTDGSSDFHTGHFIASSVCSTELRYDLNNLKPQCSACNVWKSGDWLSYERHLIRDYGEDFIKELKERNEKTKGLQYREEWFTSKIKEYEVLLESWG